MGLPERPGAGATDERIPAAGTAIDARQMWANHRFQTETHNLVTKRYGGKRKQHWDALLLGMKVFAWGHKCFQQLIKKCILFYQSSVFKVLHRLRTDQLNFLARQISISAFNT